MNFTLNDKNILKSFFIGIRNLSETCINKVEGKKIDKVKGAEKPETMAMKILSAIEKYEHKKGFNFRFCEFIAKKVGCSIQDVWDFNYIRKHGSKTFFNAVCFGLPINEKPRSIVSAKWILSTTTNKAFKKQPKG